MMSFNDFVHKYNLKNTATSNVKVQIVLVFTGLDNLEVHLGDGPFSSDIGIVNLHPMNGTHWFANTNENYFDSYSCSPLEKLSSGFIKQNGLCLYSEYKIKVKKILFCMFLFINTSLDKSLRNRFYICCFEFVLSKNFLNINDVTDNSNR